MTFSVLEFCRCERLFRPPAQPMPALHLVQVLQQIKVVVPTFHPLAVATSAANMSEILAFGHVAAAFAFHALALAVAHSYPPATHATRQTLLTPPHVPQSDYRTVSQCSLYR